jgi:hypothetical protein
MSEIRYLSFPLTKDCSATIEFYGGVVTREGIEMIQRVLALTKDAFPKAKSRHFRNGSGASLPWTHHAASAERRARPIRQSVAQPSPSSEASG